MQRVFDISASLQVAGVVGRAETLSAIFFLLALFTYKRAALGKGEQIHLLSLRLYNNIYQLSYSQLAVNSSQLECGGGDRNLFLKI